jgi:pantoate--beta-alanine ligase
MEVVRTKAEAREAARAARARGARIGFVPTMGYLHDGHLALVRTARSETDFVVVSIFVNPLQFGPSEDFERYPRDEERDLALLESQGVDLVFIPSTEEMYPEPMLTTVHVAGLTEGLCGATRPGHFDGVATVVSKLFNIVQPDRAYFGEKDYQQLKVIEKMVRDLDVPVVIVPVPTVREATGLAMSSRNEYLNPEERSVAAHLFNALVQAAELYSDGVRDATALTDSVRSYLYEFAETIAVEYVEVRDAETLEEVEYISSPAILAIAARVGPARLIDHVVLENGTWRA